MLITSLAVIVTMLVCVMIHYEALLRLTIALERTSIHHRIRVAFALLGAMVAHFLEVAVFALAYYILLPSGKYGSLYGAMDESYQEALYFSFINYTSLGYGDIVPIGALRFMAGVESLTGLVLIAWTASFIYMQMQQYWDDK